MSLRGKKFLCAAGILVVVLAGCRKSETPGAGAAGTTPSPSQADPHPPFGFIDTPKENDTVAAGTWSYGWALDDSGVAGVTVSLDNGPASAAAAGQPFPGVKEAYPTYPDADKAGFGFPMPSAAAGPHLLTVTITAKDGGKTELKRHVQIK
jgi:hypothetical protein